MRLGTLQQRAGVAKVAFSADGKLIVGVRGGKYVSVWDADTGKLTRTSELPGEGASFRYWISPDGRHVADDQPIRDEKEIWDIASGKLALEVGIKGYRYLTSVAFSPDGTSVAAVALESGKGAIRVWRLKDGKELFALDTEKSWPEEVIAFSPDGKRFLGFVSSPRRMLHSWDLATGKTVWAREMYDSRTMVVGPDRILLITDRSTTPTAIDANTGATLPPDKLPRVTPNSRLALTPDGTTLLVSDPGDTAGVNVWDLTTGKERCRLAAGGAEVLVSPDGKKALTNDGLMRLWDLATGKPLWEDTFDLGHADEVRNLAFSRDGRLASVAADGSLRTWDLETGKPLKVWSNHRPKWPGRLHSENLAGATAVDLSADGRVVASGGSDEKVVVRDAGTGDVLHTLKVPPKSEKDLDRRVFQLRLSPDGRRAVAIFGGRNRGDEQSPHNLGVWDLKTEQLIARYNLPKLEPSHCAISPDARTVAAAGALIDATTGTELRRLEGTGTVSALLAFSDDGLLVVGSCVREQEQDGVKRRYGYGVHIWEAATGKSIARLKTDTAVLGHVKFLPGGRFVATNDYDGIRVWDIRTGQVVFTRPMPQKVRDTGAYTTFAGCLGFTPDGRRLITGHPDGCLLAWDVKLPETQPEALTAKDVEKMGADLKGDASTAWAAVWRLADAPDVALPMLRQRLKPVRAADERVTAPLLKALDDDSFAKRQAAAERLKELGPEAEPALRNALEGTLSAESRRHIETLLEALSSPVRRMTEDELCDVRAVAVLSRTRGEEARRLLEELAKGVESAPLTRAAKNALTDR